MKFQQIRGATSIVTYKGTRLLVDPFLAPKGSFPPVPSPCNTLANPLVDLPLPASEIIAADAVIVTHMHHFDHFDDAAASALDKTLPVFVQSDKEACDMRKLGFGSVIPMKAEGVTLKDITIYRTEALHGDGVTAAYYYQKYNLPSEACGFVLRAPSEPTFYAAGDTLWFDGVRAALSRFQPDIIALNAANAQLYDGTPILMGEEGLHEVAMAAPEARIIATHLDAVNHAHVSRADIRRFIRENNLERRVLVPEDGETLSF